MKSAVVLLLTLALPAAAGDLRENAFFKALEGNWTGQGEMTNAQQETAPLMNQIEASFNADGDVFTIRGNLTVDHTPMEYSWTYTTHELEGIYRGEYVTANQPDHVTEFQVNIDQDALVASLEPMAGGTIIRLRKAIEGDRYTVNFEFIDASLGTTTLQGEVRFERESQADS